MPIRISVSTHRLRHHLFTLASALSLLLSVAACALWLVWVALFARRRPTVGAGCDGGGTLRL